MVQTWLIHTNNCKTKNIDNLTVIAWIATCGSLFPSRFNIDLIQSLAFFELAPALSQISIIKSHCSDVLFSLVALSVKQFSSLAGSRYFDHFYIPTSLSKGELVPNKLNISWVMMYLVYFSRKMSWNVT